MKAPVLCDLWQPRRGQAAILEAHPGEARSRLIRRILETRPLDLSRTWLLDCDFEGGGVWAGVQDLMASVIGEIRTASPALVSLHDHELLQVLPELQTSLRLRFQNLTDLSSGEEKVRGYPADRAFRSVHGLIDLLADWKPSTADGRWLMVCENYDGASQIGLHFFRELMRRRGQALDLSLLLVVRPGTGERLQAAFPPAARGPLLRAELAEEKPSEHDPAEASALAEDLDRGIGNDALQIRRNLARMIRLWDRAGNADRSLKWNLLGLSICTDGGLYADACRYGESARRLAKAIRPGDAGLRWMIFFKLFSCHMALRDTSAALRLAREDALGQTERPEWRSQLYYLMAMLYARYLPQKDFEKAEDYLRRGLEELEQAELTEEDRAFRIVFNLNGLAMVRHFQGRFEEAINLCRSSFDRLAASLREDRHRLHRSVLLYNLGQVYSAIGCLDEAIVHYSAAIAMDPYYSEYYNDRGGLLLKMGAVAEARRDFEQAIELSPPYFEVYTNLGQCHRRSGKAGDAVKAYSRALDLEPDQVLALLGRAQAWEGLDQAEEAIADYTRALELNPKLWEALANRAVLLYQLNRHGESLDDLDKALKLAPDQGDLYQNRAVVRADLGLTGDAAQDLETYLSLQPHAPDRAEVEERLLGLRALART
jgi:tetratricopeptide (TPR) repeat protein